MILTKEIKIIKDFGEKYGWPAMVLKRNGDQVVKIMGNGKGAWRNVAVLSHLRSPYNQTCLELLDAIERKDVWLRKS